MQAAREDTRAAQAAATIERPSRLPPARSPQSVPVALGAEAAPRRKKSAEVDENVVDVTENAEEEVDDLEVPGMDAMMAMVDAQRIARERRV